MCPLGSILQVIVYVPMGGQTTTKVEALSPQGEWVEVYRADQRDVDYTTSGPQKVPYVAFTANTCRTPFATDTIRVTFNLDFVAQYIEVDAVKLIGTAANQAGVPSDPWQRLAYIPDTYRYGDDTLTYVLYDCPYKAQRQSQPATLTMRVAGVNNPPALARSAFNVSSTRWPPNLQAMRVLAPSLKF